MMPSRITFLCLLACVVFTAPAKADPAAEAIAQLRDGDFEARTGAEQILSDLVAADTEGLLPTLLDPALQRDPEIRLRTKRILRQVFEREVLGIGATTIKAELGRFLWVYNDGRPSLGPIVEKIPPGSLAAKAGMEPGDNIRSVDGENLDWADGLTDLRKRLSARKPGEIVHLKIWRVGLGRDNRHVANDGSWFECDVTLEQGASEATRPERPGEFAAWSEALTIRHAK